MPTIQIDQKAFEKYVGKKFPLEKLKDRISYLGTDLEGIEDGVIDVEIFPNRPDLLSAPGFARAFASFTGVKPGLREYKVKDSKQKVIIDKAMKDVRPHTSCALVKNLKFDDEKIKEVIDIQEKLHITFGRNRKKMAMGIYPLEKITMPIHFTAKKPEDIVFHPLEGEGEMNALEILEKHPTGQKYGHLLEGKKLFPVFLDDTGKVLSLTPVINSHDVGKVTEKTTEVFVECSGHDKEVQHQALLMVVCALADMGGEVESMTLEYPDETVVTPDVAPKRMKVDLDFMNQWIGLDLNEKQFADTIAKMGYGYEKGEVIIPCYRTDILHQTDIAEDMAIGYGFDNLDDIIPEVATVAKESPIESFKDKIMTLLVGLRYLEACTYNLTNKEFQSTRMNADVDMIELANAISLEYNVLRSWVLPNLMEIFATNKHHEFPQKVATFGRTFHRDKKEETGIKETQWLGFASSHESVDYTEVRQVIDYLFGQLGLSDYTVEEFDAPYFISGRAAQIVVKGKQLAFFGEVNPEVLTQWELTMPVAAGEVNVELLMELVK